MPADLRYHVTLTEPQRAALLHLGELVDPTDSGHACMREAMDLVRAAEPVPGTWRPARPTAPPFPPGSTWWSDVAHPVWSLARRAVALAVFPGPIAPDTRHPAWSAGSYRDDTGVAWWLIGGEWLPVLTDPATLGMLLAHAMAHRTQIQGKLTEALVYEMPSRILVVGTGATRTFDVEHGPNLRALREQVDLAGSLFVEAFQTLMTQEDERRAILAADCLVTVLELRSPS